jgi:predicted DNA-binding transcriptional regulator AlpA
MTKGRRKATPIKTPKGVANLSPNVSLGSARSAVNDAPSERRSATVATLGARAPPDVLDDPIWFLPEVERATRLSGTTIWRHETAGKFPRRHKHGKFAAWFRSEIVAYLESLRSTIGGPAPAPAKAIAARRQAARRRRESMAA